LNFRKVRNNPEQVEAAEEHRRAGLAGVIGKHYEDGHWLSRFDC
jgi:hypothetical protein